MVAATQTVTNRDSSHVVERLQGSMAEPQLHCEESIEESDAPASQPSPCKCKISRRSQERYVSMDGIQAGSGQQPWQVDQDINQPAQMTIKPQQLSHSGQTHTASRGPQEQLLQPHMVAQQAPQPLQQIQQLQLQQRVQQQSAVQTGQQAVPAISGSVVAPAPDGTEDDDALIETADGQGPGFVALLALHDLSSALPFGPRSFISSEGATMGPGSQRRRLSVAVPGIAQGSGGSNAKQMLQSPPGGMMASLMAEAAQSGMTALNTPWSAHNHNLVNILSPTGAVLDVNPLASPRMPGLASAIVLESSTEQAMQHVQLPRMPSAGLLAELPAAAALAAAAEATVEQNSGGANVRQQRGTQQQAGGNLVGCKRRRAAPYDDGCCAEICNAAQAAAFAAMGSPGTNTSSDLAALAQWQHTIEAAEQHWGPSHPAVGRAWLELARALQAVDKDSERAKLATKKAFDICQILLRQTAMESHAQESFQYLLDKFNRKATAAKQAAQTAAAYAAQEAAATAAAEASAAAAAAATVVPAMPAPPAAVVPAVLQQQYQQQQLAYAAHPGASQPGVSAAMMFPVSYPAAAVLQPHAGSIPPAAVPQQAACEGTSDASSTRAGAGASETATAAGQA